MKFEQADNEHITVRLTRHELGILNNCLNETLDALDEDELAIRVGASAEEVSELLAEFRRLIRVGLEGPRTATG